MFNFKILFVSLLSLLFGCKQPGKPKDFKIQDNIVYYRDEAIPESDAKSFTALDDHYAKDNNHVWYCHTYRSGQDYFSTKRNRIAVMEKADAPTFKLLQNRYAKDKANIFFQGELFPVKDVSTFQVLDYSFAKDQFSGYYIQLEIKGSDGNTFTGLDSHYSKDKNHIYYSDVVPGEPAKSIEINNADISTFTILDDATDSTDAKDKNGFYYRGTRVK